MVAFGLPCGSDGKKSTCIQETWLQSLGREDSLEEAMATHSSILAWRIPRTEPGGLQSMGLQRAGCDLATEHKNIVLPHSYVFENYVLILLLTSNKLNGNSVYGFISVFF